MNTEPIEILLVEDNASDIALMQELMKRSKVSNRLYAVKNGAEALSYLYKKGKYSNAPTPHLILLDLNMPIKGGREVLADIKENDALKHIPVIVLTSSDAEQDIYNAYQLHANCYLVKPTDLNQYYRVINAIETFWMTLSKIPGWNV